MLSQRQRIGANIVYSWHDERFDIQDGGKTYNGYISFDDDEVIVELLDNFPETDKYGVRDEHIFFSTSKEEFEKWINDPDTNKEDFVIHSFEYNYMDIKENK